jgi:hypothetical protein
MHEFGYTDREEIVEHGSEEWHLLYNAKVVHGCSVDIHFIIGVSVMSGTRQRENYVGAASLWQQTRYALRNLFLCCDEKAKVTTNVVGSQSLPLRVVGSKEQEQIHIARKINGFPTKPNIVFGNRRRTLPPRPLCVHYENPRHRTFYFLCSCSYFSEVTGFPLECCQSALITPNKC